MANQINRSDQAPEPPDGWRRALADGRAGVFAEAVERYHDDLLRFARAFTGADEMADDAVQETFLRLVERHRLYDPRRPFRPWIFVICRNACVTLLRGEARESARVVSIDEDESPPDWPDAGECVRDRITREQETGEAVRLLRELPEEARTVVLFHLFERMTFREIGAAIGRPERTVSTIYYRALKRLRAAFPTAERQRAYQENEEAQS